ncbi:MAG: hypothetical protein II948_09140, partial [Synergistaceae bacterium]|nr:hypothetical protein [Synergistaceae bacterium]
IHDIHPDPAPGDDDSDYGDYNTPASITLSVTGVDDSSPKRGLTADGASQLLIKAVTNKDGYVAFSMTDGLGLNIKLTDESANSSNIMKVKASANNTFESTAILTAPESFPSSFNLPSGSFNIYATFAEDVNDLSTSEIKASQILTLHAAPVVLIHGIFGKSESTFGKGGAGIWGVLEHTGLSLHPWNYYNSNGPNDVIRENQESELSSKIKEIQLDLSVMKGIVCKKVDIVAHSMGGLMARRFLQADSFAKSNNPVRRIITVATPHRGSPWADIMVGDINDNWLAAYERAWLKIEAETLLEAISGTGISRDATSAWNDLREANSIAFGFHGGVPMYSIYGNARDDRPSDIPEFLMNIINDNIFPRQGHDVAVSVISAATAYFSDKGSHGHNGAEFWHSAICKQDIIGEEVRDLLKGPVDKFKVFSSSNSSSSNTSSSNINITASNDSSVNYLIEDELTLTASPEALNSNETLTLRASLDTPASGDLFMAINTACDDKIFLSLKPSNDAKTLFETQINAASLDAGLNGARCFVEGSDGFIYLSGSALFTVKPDLNGASVTGLELSDKLGTVYTRVNSAVGVGVYAKLSDGREFDVASPKMGTVWTADDPSIAEVTSSGLIKGLKAGSTKLTASYEGFSAVLSVDVAAAYSNNNNSNNNSSSSSSGGCNAGLCLSGLLILALASLRKR